MIGLVGGVNGGVGGGKLDLLTGIECVLFDRMCSFRARFSLQEKEWIERCAESKE